MPMTVDFYKKKLEVKERHLTEMRTAYSELRNAYLQLVGTVEKLETECQSARSIVWAMAKTAGGEVRIPKMIMQAMDATCVLNSFYDPEDDTTVVRSKNEQLPEKKNGDGKGGDPR